MCYNLFNLVTPIMLIDDNIKALDIVDSTPFALKSGVISLGDSSSHAYAP